MEVTPGGAGLVLSLCAYLIVGMFYLRDGSDTKTSFKSFRRSGFETEASLPMVAATYRRAHGGIRNLSKPRPKPVPTAGLTQSSGSGSMNHSCYWKVQFWGNFKKLKLDLRDGDYYCPETNCTVNFVKKSGYDVMKSSHVALLHHRGNWLTEKVARLRSPDQIIAYWTRETPPHSRRPMSSLGLFNWTVTYNSRSEVTIPYGSIIKIDRTDADTQLTSPQKNWAEGKTGLAIWISSNCRGTAWPRTKFVRKLAEMVKVDMFGRCGNRKCGSDCLQKINSYKFYLAFENHYCEDYVTEKMWRNAFQHDAVPIVYGPPKSDYERMAPENSFIHISDFKNVSALASYLMNMDKDDTKYNKFFEWRRDYRVEQLAEDRILKEESLCSISRRLVNLKASWNVTGSSANWFKGTCRNNPFPAMV